MLWVISRVVGTGKPGDFFEPAVARVPGLKAWAAQLPCDDGEHPLGWALVRIDPGEARIVSGADWRVVSTGLDLDEILGPKATRIKKLGRDFMGIELAIGARSTVRDAITQIGIAAGEEWFQAGGLAAGGASTV